MNLTELNVENLLESMPPSMREAFSQFQKNNATLDDVGQLLAGGQYSGVTLKGTGRFVGDLWDAAKKEFAELLCDEGGKYDDIRRRFPKVTKENQALFLAQASVIMASALGVQAGLVTPFIVWLLLAAVRLGKESCCAVLRPKT